MKNLVFVLMLFALVSNAQIGFIGYNISDMKTAVNSTGHTLYKSNMKNTWLANPEGSRMLVETNDNGKVITIMVFYTTNKGHADYVKYIVGLVDSIDEVTDAGFKSIGYDSFVAKYKGKLYVVRDNVDKRIVTFEAL